MKPKVSNKYTLILGILLLAAGWKAVLAALGAFPFNSDEAVVALMARHILQGERPVFFYGQSYMGSLDAYLIAAGFWLLGEQVWVIRLVQGLLYTGLIGTTIWLGKEALGSLEKGILAGGLLIFPTVNMTLYTTVTLGGYVESLIAGNLILVAAVRIAQILDDQPGEAHQFPFWLWNLAFGIICGLGLWILGLTVVYMIPAAIFLVWKNFRRAARTRSWSISIYSGMLWVLGAVVGSTPWWIYALTHGFTRLIGELAGSAVSVEQGTWIARIVQHFANFGLLGLTVLTGLRPPWEVRWLALPLAPFVLAIWFGVGIWAVRRVLRKGQAASRSRLLIGVCLVLVIAFLVTPFGVDPSGRYFLPLGVIFSLIAADCLLEIRIKQSGWKFAAAALLVVFNIAGTVQCALANPPGITTQFNPETQVDHRYDAELARFLLSEGETRGYTDYWVSYPLAFLSQEQLIYIPALPYHADLRYTSRDDRYPAYDRMVAGSSRVAYITAGHPLLDALLRKSLRQNGVAWEEKTIGDFRVFYHLSWKATPQSLSISDLFQ